MNLWDIYNNIMTTLGSSLTTEELFSLRANRNWDEFDKFDPIEKSEIMIKEMINFHGMEKFEKIYGMVFTDLYDREDRIKIDYYFKKVTDA